jgi:hypothetical protein
MQAQLRWTTAHQTSQKQPQLQRLTLILTLKSQSHVQWQRAWKRAGKSWLRLLKLAVVSSSPHWSPCNGPIQVPKLQKASVRLLTFCISHAVRLLTHASLLLSVSLLTASEYDRRSVQPKWPAAATPVLALLPDASPAYRAPVAPAADMAELLSILEQDQKSKRSWNDAFVMGAPVFGDNAC